MRIPWIEGRREEAAWQRAALLPLSALSLLYGAGARLHRSLYTRGWRSRTRLGCRVVSVGNLGVGGSGKTPMAALLARELKKRGHRVVIASRGYGREARTPVVVVSDGRHVLARLEEAGDAPRECCLGAPCGSRCLRWREPGPSESSTAPPARTTSDDSAFMSPRRDASRRAAYHAACARSRVAGSRTQET